MPTCQVTLWDPATRRVLAHVELDAAPASPIADLLQALPSDAGHRPAVPTWFVGEVPLDPRTTFAESPITPGCHLSRGAPGPRPAHERAGAVGTLRAVRGPAAGATFRLRPGEYTVGHPGQAQLGLAGDPEAGRQRPVRVTVGSAADLVVAPGSPDERRFAPGAELLVGATTLTWSPRREGRRATRREDGRLYFDRSFAPTPRLAPLTVRLPAAEQHVRAVWATVMTFALPMLAAGALALLMHQVFFLLMAVLGPIGGVGHLLLERRQRQAREADLAARRAEAARQITDHVTREAELRRRVAPGLGEVLDLADGTTEGLWPRTVESADALLLRVGTADQPAEIQLDGEGWPLLPEPIVPDAPVTIDLRTAGVLSLVGAPAPTAAMARWLLLQLTTLRSPEDLQLVLITADDGAAWEWVRWLPHLTGGDDGEPPRVGTTADTRLRRAAELRELVEQRRRLRDGPASGGVASGGVAFEDVVVVLIGALTLRELSGMKEVLRDGPGVGVYTLCTDVGSLHEARAQCRLEATTAIPGLAGGRVAPPRVSVTRDRSDAPISALAEGCTPLQAEQVARALCPLRDRLMLATAGRSMPFPVRFTELVDLPAITAGQVAALWRTESGPTTRIPLGADAEGVVHVDIARQGPHTMLGGATGAGKSILLQTFVTSLLLANAPDELNLVLVDFKGGSAFLPFEGCPHVVSLIRSTGRTAADVFDQAAARRVLASVRTEVARREAILAPFGGEIDAYWTTRRAAGGSSWAEAAGSALPALPRLVLVFDEFARVLEVDGDFLKELVNVAAKGRSLGMHLVLATQSLQGKLSPELKNNITLRISLRQNEPADSIEVLDSPEAASIPGRLRGRGLILCTTDEVRLPRAFQSGYLGGSARDHGPAPVSVRRVAWSAVGLPRAEVVEPTSGPTDQDVVIAAIEAAAPGFTAPFRPVLPPLADRIELTGLGSSTRADAMVLPFGVVDEPERQRQPLAVLDLGGTDRVMVSGGSQTGRTTFARTLITALAQRFRPDQVHLYVIERVPSGLAAYAGLPHCGGVISAAEPDRVRRLVQWLSGEVERRRWVRLSDNGTGMAVGPAIVVVIDGWEVFENRADPAFVETSLLTTLREVIAVGVTVGVHVVAIGGPSLATGKVAEQYQRRLVLPFPREEDRRACVASGTTLPPVLPGRAVDAATGHHVQLCLPGVSAEDLVSQVAPATWSIGQVGSSVTLIPALPARVALTEVKPDADGPEDVVVVGVGGPAVEPVAVQLFDDGPHLMLISGPPRSGRSTALRTVLDGLTATGVPVLLVASPRSPLAGVATSGLVEVARGPALDDAALRAAAERLGTRFAVLVDDVHQLSVKPTAQGFEELPNLLEEIADDALGRRCLVLAGDGLAVLNRRRRGVTPLVERAIESGHRLLLTPTRLQDAREHGFTLEADQLFAAPPGRGYLASGRTATLIQVAQPPADC